MSISAMRAIGLLAMLAGLVYAGWAARGWRDDSIMLAEQRIATSTRDIALQATAEAIAKIKVTNTTIRQRTEKEVYEKPVYRDCRHDAVGLQIINAALTEPAGDIELPAADSP